MTPSPLKLAAGLLLLFVATAAAFLWGRTQGTRWGESYLENEVRGNLAIRVEMLSRLRTGDENGAIDLAEQSVDTAIVTLPQGQAFNDLPESTQNVLSAAKLYRTAHPSPRSEVQALLAAVPSLPSNHPFCSEALRQLAASTPEKSTAGPQ